MWAKSECQGMLLAVADNILGMTLPEDGFVQDGRQHFLCTLNRANHTIEIPVNPGSDVRTPLLAALENVIILAFLLIDLARNAEIAKR